MVFGPKQTCQVRTPVGRIGAYVSPRGGAESVRTFKCRGGLASDGSRKSLWFDHTFVDCRLKKSSHCRSPVLAPVRSAMFVGRATFSLTHRCLGFSRVTSCTKEVRLEVVHQWGGCVFSCHDVFNIPLCMSGTPRSKEKYLWVQGLLAQPSPHVTSLRPYFCHGR